jgi:hypothetical protein
MTIGSCLEIFASHHSSTSRSFDLTSYARYQTTLNTGSNRRSNGTVRKGQSDRIVALQNLPLLCSPCCKQIPQRTQLFATLATVPIFKN